MPVTKHKYRIANLKNAKPGRRLAFDAAALPSSAMPVASTSTVDAPVSDSPGPAKLSTFQKRLKLLNECAEFSDSNFLDRENENIIINKKVFASAWASAFCFQCNVLTNLSFKDVDGDVSIEVQCPICDEVLFSKEPEKVTNKKFAADTSSFILHSLNTGYGFSGYNSLCSNLNLHSVNSRRYEEYKHFLGNEVCKKNTKSMKDVRACIEKAYGELEIFPDDQGILDIEVSFDGTWHKRGHTSHYGAAAVIECHTGFIVDFEVLSNFCHWCSKSKKRTSKEKEEHKEACNINFNGTSQAMEKEAALKMWQRSVEDHKLRYTTFVSDGDSSAYNSVIGLHNGEGPYSKKVVKEECVNHISKRLGTRLRLLKKTTTEKVVTKTGKNLKKSQLAGKNKLTDKVITSLTKFFGQAIRENVNKTVQSMRDSALRGYYHCSSTDKEPRHEYCPTGEKSWCFYNEAIAKNEKPGPHKKKMKVRFELDKPELKHVLGIYLDLTRDDLLSKCLKGRTQNANESFHAKVWGRVSKIRFTSLPTLKYAISGAVSNHNFGYLKGCFTRRDLGFISTVSSKRKLEELDKERARKSMTPKRGRKRAKIMDDADYQPGAF